MRARVWLPLAALAAGLALWLALTPDAVPAGAAATPERGDRSARQPAGWTELAAGAEPSAGAARELAGLPAGAVQEPRPTVVLSGRVLLPAGAPRDETLVVAAFGARPGEWSPHLTIDAPRFPDSPAEPAPFAIAPVDVAGAFTLALAEPREELWLQVDGRFLALAEPVLLTPPADGELLLRPALGTWIHGVVVGARAGQPIWLGTDRSGSQTDLERLGGELRVALADGDGRYELRGVRIGSTWWVGTRADGTALAFRGGLVGAPGAELVIDLENVPGATLSGRVVLERATEGEGVPGALVAASPLSTRTLLGIERLFPSAITEADGAFRLEGAAFGPCRVAAREGFCTGSPLELDVRGDVADLRFAIDAKSAITGRVLLPSGRPAAGAYVRVLQGRVHRGVPAGPDGRFRVGCLDAGAQADVEAQLPARAPGAVVLKAKAKVVAGEHVELVLAPIAPIPQRERPAPTLSGRVLAPDGSPVAGARVYLSELERGEEAPWTVEDPKATTDALGRFTLEDWGSASLGVGASAPNFAPSELVAIAPGEPVDLVLRPGGGLFGTVYDEAGAPQPRFFVRAFRVDGGDLQIAGTDASGAFRFEALLPGTYALSAEPLRLVGADDDEQATQRDRERRASAVVVAGVDTRADVGAPPASPVRVFGRVTASGKATRAQLLFAADGGMPLDARRCNTAADGRYAIELAPGRYRRTVISVAELGAGFQLDVVDVPRAAELRLDVELSAGRVRGRVLAGDDPCEGIEVAAMRLDAPPGSEATGLSGTTAEGAFTIESLAPGRYQVMVREKRAGLPFRPVIVELAEDAEVEVLLRAEPGGRLRVIARDEKGRAARARVVVVGADGVVAAHGKTDARGAADLVLVPGSYDVFASTQSLLGAGSFAVTADGATEAPLVLAPAGWLCVRVVDGAGRPVAAAVAVTGDAAAPPAFSDFRALLEGNETIDLSAEHVGPLLFGRYDVAAQAPDGRTGSKSVLVTSEGKQEVLLRLRD